MTGEDVSKHMVESALKNLVKNFILTNHSPWDQTMAIKTNLFDSFITEHSKSTTEVLSSSALRQPGLKPNKTFVKFKSKPLRCFGANSTVQF